MFYYKKIIYKVPINPSLSFYVSFFKKCTYFSYFILDVIVELPRTISIIKRFMGTWPLTLPATTGGSIDPCPCLHLSKQENVYKV